MEQVSEVVIGAIERSRQLGHEDAETMALCIMVGLRINGYRIAPDRSKEERASHQVAQDEIDVLVQKLKGVN